jgi:hypothetical protein
MMRVFLKVLKVLSGKGKAMNIVEKVWREFTVAASMSSTYNVDEILSSAEKTVVEYDSIFDEGKRVNVEIRMISYGVSEMLVDGESVWKAKDPKNDPVAPGTDSYRNDPEGRMVVGVTLALHKMKNPDH